MEKPRTEKLIELLKQYPDGLTMEQLVEMLKVKTPKDIGNTVQLLKQRQMQIKKINNKYMLIDNPVKKALCSTSYDVIASALSKNPDGLTCIEIAKVLKVSKEAATNRIYHARQKGYLIEFKNGRYYYQGMKSLVKIVEQPMSSENNRAIDLIPKEFHEPFINLSEADRIDFIDMLRKSIYYRKSALSILESNAEVKKIVSSIEKRF